jgi:predicted RNA-binding protein with TRAM domain
MRGENVMEDFSKEREGGYRGPRRFPPKPVNVGQEYEIDIKEMSQRGDGIARVEGFVVFVPKANLGDHARIRVTRVSSKFAEAELIERQKHEEKETGPL